MPVNRMAESRADKVRDAIDAIEMFHELGIEVLDEIELRQKDKQKGIIEALANEKGINPDTLRKSTQFAKGYSPTDLIELCDQIKKEQVDHDDSRQIFGKSHVIRIVSVPKGRTRISIQKSAISQGWSCKKLSDEIGKRLGPRRVGGRWPQIPEGLTGFLVKLERMCEEWTRLGAALNPDCELGKKHERQLNSMPTPLRRSITDALERISELKGKINAELKRLKPSRESRVSPQTGKEKRQ